MLYKKQGKSFGLVDKNARNVKMEIQPMTCLSERSDCLLVDFVVSDGHHQWQMLNFSSFGRTFSLRQF